jgi:hypothetical protein
VKTVAVFAALAAAACSPALAAFTVAHGGQRPALRVDARGSAEVSWTVSGARRTLLVPLRGKSLPGGRVASDASKSASAAIPFRKVVRRGRDGTLYALQAWQVLPGGPVELRFSRWKGDPMDVTLTTAPKFDTEVVSGTATFAGTPASGYTVTPEGKRIRVTAYVDCLCGGKWKRVQGVTVKADGTFSLLIRAAFVGTRYRAVVTGPSRGTTIAPDGMGTADSSL